MRDIFGRMKIFHMHRYFGYSRHDRNIGTQPSRERTNIPRPICAHLENEPSRILLRDDEKKYSADDVDEPFERIFPRIALPQYRERHAYLAVHAFLALAHMHMIGTNGF